MESGKTQAHEKCVCVFLGVPGGARFCRLEDILDSRPFLLQKNFWRNGREKRNFCP